MDVLEVNDISYSVKIHYEKRNNSRVSIGKKEINIRVPLFLNREEMSREVLKLKTWARNKLKENPDRFKQEDRRKYIDEERLKIGDEEYILKIRFKDKQNSSAKIIGNILEFCISSNIPQEKQNTHVSKLMSRCIAAKRLPKLREKIYELNNKHFNQKINKVFFKNTKSRWGSCSKKGNINISTRLLFAPDKVLEYVCIHELAHLIEHNHSERFWKLVENTMPAYRESELWLKENGKKCMF